MPVCYLTCPSARELLKSCESRKPPEHWEWQETTGEIFAYGELRGLAICPIGKTWWQWSVCVRKDPTKPWIPDEHNSRRWSCGDARSEQDAMSRAEQAAMESWEIEHDYRLAQVAEEDFENLCACVDWLDAPEIKG